MPHQREERKNGSWLSKAERTVGHRFRNRELLRAALTHPSTGEDGKAFQRLEFVGDAVLTLLMSLHLYKRYPDFPPGLLTRLRASLVNRRTLAHAATQLGLPDILRLGKAEERGGRRRPTLLAASFEAVVAALFLDGGRDAVTAFLENHFFPLISPDPSLDPKSELQHLVQTALKVPPRYRLLHHWGPPHARRFEVAVEVRGQILGRGKGDNRREAEREAAHVALTYVRENHNILGPPRG